MAFEFTVTSHVDEALSDYEKAKKRGLWKIGATAERYAKDIVPVVTGRLKNSITHTSDDDAAYIGSNVEYAPYVELGTSKRKPKPYLKPAIQNHKDQYYEIMMKELLDASKKYSH